MKFPGCGIIKGIDPEAERKVVENAGKPDSITIATLAAGRGMDIKLDEKAKLNGGLHVIIPYLMPNIRCLEQAIGRSGRQGQPGTATVYVDQDDKYELSIEFHETYNHLNKLQTIFSQYLRENYSWIYEYPVKYPIIEEYNFGMTIKELIERLKNIVNKRKYSLYLLFSEIHFS